MKVEKTTFVTFYSFKGGVGRSMALVNTAYLLYKSGRKVLIIDADLEAPGLWNVGSFKYNKKHKGFVEFVLEYQKRCDEYLEQGPKSDYPKEKIIPDPKKYIASVEVEEIEDKSEGYGPGGKIDIMPAGSKNKGYSEKLLSINFEKLFSKYSGSVFFQETRERIRNKKEYDYVLIDSRTGFSDSGDICTHELCDHLVVLTSLNNQNIEGTKSFLDKWKKIAGKIEKKGIALVATPVPLGEEELKRVRLKAAEKKLKMKINLKIFYHPKLALIEEPFVLNSSDSPISFSYHNIFENILTWGKDHSIYWYKRLEKLFLEKKYDEAIRCLKEIILLSQNQVIKSTDLIKIRFMSNQLSLDLNKIVQEEEAIPETRSFFSARFYSLLKENELALRYLKKAIEHDPENRKEAFEEDDFAPLRDNPKFIALVSPPKKKRSVKARSLSDLSDPFNANV